MHFERIKTPGIAHVAYFLGAKGEAVVVDPRRDIDEYLKIARKNKVTIKFILETHRREDFVIGSSELAKLTGAKIVTFDHELFGHSDIRLKDGEALTFAGLKVVALHTPGHTPESTSYAVYLDDVPGRAWGVFGAMATAVAIGTLVPNTPPRPCGPLNRLRLRGREPIRN